MRPLLMWGRFPRDLDPLLTAFAGFEAALALRATGRAARARFGPAQPHMWSLVVGPLRERGTKALQNACVNGDLPKVQWITLCFILTPADVKSNFNCAFRAACTGGHLPVARWLADHFELTAADARDGHNNALRWSCEYGHLPVAIWMVGRFGLTAADARENYSHTLNGACERGHLSTAVWLTNHFQLTSADISGEFGGNSLNTACRRGHLSTAIWMADRFATFHMVSDLTLRSAASNGRQHIVDWLFARMKDDDMLQIAHTHPF